MVYYSKNYSAKSIAIILQTTEDFITLLVNSTILFDRFGDLTDIKENAEKYDDIEIEHPIIENIDSITNANDKVSGK